ncbi:hypothetical protein GAYE_SCF53G6121 [Galdieria yellowstonensis]|uniref:Uncharacterized protein n=1 Tax=Galdieria yellowstonensis TaxID=3028027 RepID=A0AAV9IMA9_9RHOD|nr:hypothetical protein GAYE_SCF53G6121 [Galdieria yellowstonensis]
MLYTCPYVACSFETGEFPLKEWLMTHIERRIKPDWYVTQHDPLGSFYYATWFHKTQYLSKLLKEREDSVKLSYNRLVEQGLIQRDKVV